MKCMQRAQVSCSTQLCSLNCGFGSLDSSTPGLARTRDCRRGGPRAPEGGSAHKEKSTTRHDECFDSPIRMSQRSPGGVAPFGCTAARQEEVRNRDRTQIYRWPPKSVMLPEAVQHSIV